MSPEAQLRQQSFDCHAQEELQSQEKQKIQGVVTTIILPTNLSNSNCDLFSLQKQISRVSVATLGLIPVQEFHWNGYTKLHCSIQHKGIKVSPTVSNYITQPHM